MSSDETGESSARALRQESDPRRAFMLQDSRAATVCGDTVHEHLLLVVMQQHQHVPHDVGGVLGEPPRGRGQQARQTIAARRALTSKPTFSDDRKRERQAARQLRNPKARSGLQSAWAQPQGPQNHKTPNIEKPRPRRPRILSQKNRKRTAQRLQPWERFAATQAVKHSGRTSWSQKG